MKVRIQNNTSSNDTQNNEKVEKIVYIGDSRTVQMYAYSNNDWEMLIIQKVEFMKLEKKFMLQKFLWD